MHIYIYAYVCMDMYTQYIYIMAHNGKGVLTHSTSCMYVCECAYVFIQHVVYVRV